MVGQAPGPINFTMFLTLFGERLQGTDPEDVIKNAFGCFDEDGTGAQKSVLSKVGCVHVQLQTGPSAMLRLFVFYF